MVFGLLDAADSVAFAQLLDMWDNSGSMGFHKYDFIGIIKTLKQGNT
jgi:hypothetical protein